MLYDYQCQQPGCLHIFEIDKKLSDPAPKKCPKCKKGKVEIYFKKVAQVQTFYSPLHPRRNRGIGNL